MERSSGGVRNVRHSQEEEIFFVYDRDTLKSEWDNQEDAIIYFSPTTVSTVKDFHVCVLAFALNGLIVQRGIALIERILR